MVEPSQLRECNLQGLDVFARRRKSLCQAVELVARTKWIQQGDVRHPSLEVAIVNPANGLDGGLYLARWDQHDGSGKGFFVHMTPGE
jgi:hypothetical protein